MLVLEMIDQFEEFNFTWHEVGHFSTDLFEFDMVAAADEISCLFRPASGAVSD